MTENPPGTAARCVPLCAAGNRAPWWQHEALCPVRLEHRRAVEELEKELTTDGDT